MGKGSNREEATEEMAVGVSSGSAKKSDVTINCNESSRRVMKSKRRLFRWSILCCGRCRLGERERRRFPSNAQAVAVHPEAIDVTSWDFDVFLCEERHPGRSLECVFMELLDSLNLFASMKLDRKICQNYIQAIEAAYKGNPYHNHVHAADVLQSVGVILLKDNYFKHHTDLELLAMILSAAVHDVAHPGLNNEFHKNSQSPLSKLYADSFNERMHIAQAYEILEHESRNMLKGLSKEESSSMKRYVHAIIIATDMANHYALVQEFGGRFPPRNGFTMHELSEYDRELLLRMIVHCADISNPTRPWHLCEKWAKKITDETLNQGDEERRRKIRVTFDRQHCNLAKSQKSFLENFVLPCFKTFSSVAPAFVAMTQEIAEINKEKWEAALALNDH